MENTPELAQAIELGQNKGRWEWYFYTTLGHIVTKILDMDITFHLPDGSVYKPFTTAWQVNEFFNITPDQYWIFPNRYSMDVCIENLYWKKVEPKEREILDSYRKTMKEFFELNIWQDVDDTDTVDVLLWKIDELAEMWIEEVWEYVCNDLKEHIIRDCTWGENLKYWNNLSQKERVDVMIGKLNKKLHTHHFVHLVIDEPWRKNPNNADWYVFCNGQNGLKALYIVDSDFLKTIWKTNHDQFRNTRYL
jgi:hypothetical protein